MSAAALGVAEELPEADRLGSYPHPRRTENLYGQDAAEARFLDSFNSGRMPHAWLITGPRGIGKATLAWRLARFLIAQPLGEDDGLFGAPERPDTLATSPEHPVARRIAAGSEGNLFLLRRPWDHKAKRLKTVIDVESARDLKKFFAHSAAEQARRVVIVDSADEMNASAANAVLKVLEEPPKNALLRTSRIEAWMNSDWSSPVTTSMPSGSSLEMLSRRPSTALATWTVLASPSL